MAHLASSDDGHPSDAYRPASDHLPSSILRKPKAKLNGRQDPQASPSFTTLPKRDSSTRTDSTLGSPQLLRTFPNRTSDWNRVQNEDIPLRDLQDTTHRTRQNSDDPSTSSGYSTNRYPMNSPSPSTIDSDDTRLSSGTVRLERNPYKSTTIKPHMHVDPKRYSTDSPPYTLADPNKRYTPTPEPTPQRYSAAQQNHVTFVDTPEDDESLVELPPPPPPEELQNAFERHVPDGGYGWVIVLASFGIQMIGMGISLSFGVMYVELQEYYGEEAGVTAWVGAVCIGLALGAGPISSMMANAFGHRRSCFLGGLISAAGLFISAFSPNIYFLYVSYGVITGIGISLTYIPAVVMVGYYFEHRRPMASGIAVSGVGFGCLIYPPLAQILIEEYTWRGAMIISAGLALNMCVFAALLRPLHFHRHRVKVCDTQLLRSVTFIVFSLAEILWNIGSLIVMTVAPHHSILQGIAREQAAFLLSIVGITGTLGRLTFIFIPAHWDKLTMMTASTFVTGLPMALYPVFSTFWFHTLCCVVYGVSFGVQLAVLPVVTVDLFGLGRLTSAYGYLMLADGTGALLGPIFGGLLYDMTGAYHVSFIFGAVCSFVSGILMITILAVRLCTEPAQPRRLSVGEGTAPLAPPEPPADPPEPASEIFL